MKDYIKHCFQKHKELWFLSLTPVALILLLLARISPFFAEEIFAKRLYRIGSSLLNQLTGLLPLSVAELLVVGLTVAGIWLLIRLIIRLIRGRKGAEPVRRSRLLGHAALHLGCFLSLVLFLFIFFCGINYERYPFSHYSGLTITDSTKEELYELCVSLAIRASETREEVLAMSDITEEELAAALPEKEDYQITTAGLAADMSNREMGRAAAAAMSALAEIYPVLDGDYSTPKSLISSEFFSMTETTGIFIPFTMEANVNVACTDFTIPATMCHELSHLRGFMREDEANYIAYLACQQSDNPYVRYSGLMLALVYTGNQLYRADKDLYTQARTYYSEGVIEDFRRDSAYWNQYEDTVISTAANAANDTYLKANNQSDGAKSYGRMVDLLLAEYRQQKKENSNGTD